MYCTQQQNVYVFPGAENWFISSSRWTCDYQEINSLFLLHEVKLHPQIQIKMENLVAKIKYKCG